MSADDLRQLGQHLQTRAFGRTHEHHEVCESTNDRAAMWAREGAAHGALVTADAQTSGRGRQGRVWHSPPGENIYASLILRPPAGAPLEGLSLAVGLGLRDGLASWSDVVRLKWPNDLLAHGRKLGGILCEARWQGDRADVVVGFGLNVHTVSFPEPLTHLATSLALLDGAARTRPHARGIVLASVLGALENTLESFFAHGFGRLRPAYTAACDTLGREVHVEVGGERKPAIAERIDDAGGLWVREPTRADAFRVQSVDAV